MIALVAGLSVGDPFIKEQFLGGGADSDLEDGNESGALTTARAERQTLKNVDLVEKAKSRMQRQKFFAAQQVSTAECQSEYAKQVSALMAYPVGCIAPGRAQSSQ